MYFARQNCFPLNGLILFTGSSSDENSPLGKPYYKVIFRVKVYPLSGLQNEFPVYLMKEGGNQTFQSVCYNTELVRERNSKRKENSQGKGLNYDLLTAFQ